jgi:hypothetical protein
MIRPLSGTELVAERQVWASVTHEIRLPYTWNAIAVNVPRNPDGRIMPAMKFAVQKQSDAAPRFFNILEVRDQEEHGIEWVCKCEEKPGTSL